MYDNVLDPQKSHVMIISISCNDGDFLGFPTSAIRFENLIRHVRNGPAATGPSRWKGLAALQTFRKMGKVGCLLWMGI